MGWRAAPAVRDHNICIRPWTGIVMMMAAVMMMLTAVQTQSGYVWVWGGFVRLGARPRHSEASAHDRHSPSLTWQQLGESSSNVICCFGATLVAQGVSHCRD
jgi:hypothetical protein